MDGQKIRRNILRWLAYRYETFFFLLLFYQMKDWTVRLMKFIAVTRMVVPYRKCMEIRCVWSFKKIMQRGSWLSWFLFDEKDLIIDEIKNVTHWSFEKDFFPKSTSEIHAQGNNYRFPQTLQSQGNWKTIARFCNNVSSR